jgi:Flp pilus assembly protein TadB
MSREELRVGDAERDEVTSALHEHFAKGRLNQDELDERLTATLSARTVGDLRGITKDLPGSLEALSSEQERGPWAQDPWGRGPWGPGARRRGPHRHGPYHRGPRPFAPLFLVLVAIAFFAGAPWLVFAPLIALTWFALAFTVIRFARHRRFPLER